MKIFKKNELSFLKKIFSNNKKLQIFKLQNFSETVNPNSKKTLTKKLNLDENKFPNLDENLSNLLTEMENDNSSSADNSKVNFNQFITQKDDIIFINNHEKLELFKDIKLGDLILLNKKYLAKCLAINNKINTFVIFDRIK